MKRNLLIIASILLILVLSVVAFGCSSGNTTSSTTSKSTTTTSKTSTSQTSSSTTTSLTTSHTTTSSTTTSTTSQGSLSVYISVSVDGQLLVVAQPIAYTSGMTVDDALKAAHQAYYSGGLDGYSAGINPTWNMYLISKCWGVSNTPYVIVNDATLTATVNTVTLTANDNIIVCTGADTTKIDPVSLKATVSGDSVTVTATSWHLDFTTFSYSHKALANADVLDSKGATLGKTDADGKITLTVPADGIVVIKGYAAINVKKSAK